MCPSLFVLRTPNEELRLPTTVTTSVGEFFFKEIYEPIRGVGRGERELTRSGTITLKPSLENPKKTGKQKNIDMSTQWVLRQEASSFTHRAISVHKHMRLCRYSFLALFCFFSLSATTVLWMNWYFLFSFLFSFGLSIFCTTELNWYVLRLQNLIWKHNWWYIVIITNSYSYITIKETPWLVFFLLSLLLLLLSQLLLQLLLSLFDGESATNSKQ